MWFYDLWSFNLWYFDLRYFDLTPTNASFQNGTDCRLGKIVGFWNLGRIVAWDELSPNDDFTSAQR